MNELLESGHEEAERVRQGVTGSHITHPGVHRVDCMQDGPRLENCSRWKDPKEI
jgi:hypothetical protein